MTQRAYEWDPRPPTNRERLICGIWLAAFVAAMANAYADWRVFRGYDDWVLGGLLLAGLFLLAGLPGVRRVQGVPRPPSFWVILGLGVTGAFLLSFLDSRS